jgi:hypothetical protein
MGTITTKSLFNIKFNNRIISLYLELQQQGFNNFPMFSYLFQNSIIAGPSRASTLEQDRIVGGVEATPRSWPGKSLTYISDCNAHLHTIIIVKLEK